MVMVGEIRDLETAEIAVQASLTGHLVFSTLHTNSAVGAVTRLRDMGVEPFLLSSSLIGVLAQRLVRVLCDNCKQPYPASAADCEQLGIDAGDPPTLYRTAGCPECSQLGYKGRTGIYELIELDDEMRGRIHDGAGEQALEALCSPACSQHAPRRLAPGAGGSHHGRGSTAGQQGRLVYPATDIDPFRAPPLGQGKARSAGKGAPLARIATPQWPGGGAPCGRARKRSSAALRLLEREWPFPASQALRLSASWPAEWVNISGGVH